MIIRAYGAVVKNFERYMIAFCEFKNEIRIFKCSRIENIEVLDEIFRVAENFHLEEFWRNTNHHFVSDNYVIKSDLCSH
ncbi:WYL domain-containing protein [Clostridium tagluense]|uniref:WYL domain-containing protein n=1 Tax=Clostridium tagluense TaxID=360422 RepID=UPI001CF2021C|nr:WYL domain-containing protein [Clostridium tagluense]MCB2297414.1 WYL domain-containing protein [Clostridium tagluense]